MLLFQQVWHQSKQVQKFCSVSKCQNPDVLGLCPCFCFGLSHQICHCSRKAAPGIQRRSSQRYSLNFTCSSSPLTLFGQEGIGIWEGLNPLQVKIPLNSLQSPSFPLGGALTKEGLKASGHLAFISSEKFCIQLVTVQGCKRCRSLYIAPPV